jgi:NAD(P)-dependent dehydrogenase (short-subunit alcohol dehydrogenase family)
MSAKFKPLEGQVIVVTGAVSGLGVEAAKLAAKAGAAVVLAAQDEAAVRELCAEITQAGGRCHPVAGDPVSPEGCDRVARAAAARFGRIDSWIEAGGEDQGLANAAKALALHLGADVKGALVGFGSKFGKATRSELKAAKGAVAATLVKLPKDWRQDSPAKTAAEAALFALTKPMGEMALAAKGQALTATTQAKKHPGVVIGLGLVLAGAALWFARGRIGRVEVAVRPRLARAVRPAVIGAAKRRPVQVARLAAKHPKAALKVAKALR